MGYIENSLIDGEEVGHQATFHWLYTVNAGLGALALWIIAGICLLLGGDLLPSYALALRITAAVFGLWGLVAFLIPMIRKWTTEIAVTNKRFVQKTGWIARTTNELPLNRIEEVNLEQGIIGRLFGYGTVSVSGTGGDDPIVTPEIDDPLVLRKALAKARDEASGRTESA